MARIDKKFTEYLNEYHDSNSLDFSNWRLNPMLLFNSKSSNRRVLEIYNEILNNAFRDSDYWVLEGNEVIVSMLYTFTENDWKDLRADLVNWKPHELNLFCEILTEEYCPGSVNEDIISQKSYTYCYIITLIEPTTNPLLWSMLLDHFEYIKEGDLKPYILLEKINLLFDKIQSIHGLVSTDDGDDCFFSKSRFTYLQGILHKVIKK